MSRRSVDQHIRRIGGDFTALNALHDVGQHRMRRCRDADLGALLGDGAVHELDLGAAALRHVLRHRWPLQIAARRGIRAGQHQRLDLFQRAAIAFGCQRQLFRLQRADIAEREAERLTHPHGLAAERMHIRRIAS